MIQFAVDAGRYCSEIVVERRFSGYREYSLGSDLHFLVEDRYLKIEDESFATIVRGFDGVSFHDFLQRLIAELRNDEWAQELVWDVHEDVVSHNFAWELQSVRRFYDRHVKYLGPLREAPQVLYDPGSRELDLGLSGEYTAAVLHAHANREIVPVQDGGGADRVPLHEEVNYWLDYFGLAGRAYLQDRGRLGIGLKINPPGTKAQVDLTSVGVGVSQILPVIVLCLLAEPGDLVILEQPELHLHPALQQRLGQFLLECTNSGRQLIVETHSEHLVNRVRLAVAEGSDWAEGLVGLLFAEQKRGITRFKSSSINRFGVTEDEWPIDFFEFAAKEAQEFVAATLTKRHRGSGEQ